MPQPPDSPPSKRINFQPQMLAASAVSPIPDHQNPRKRRTSAQIQMAQQSISPTQLSTAQQLHHQLHSEAQPSDQQPPAKKSRTNTPWTAEEEQRLKQMRDQGNSWSEIAKTFANRTEGSVKKHWYKDMHYAEFNEDESEALLAAIKEYDAAKWKTIGIKLGKPAKACEQYAKQHFIGK